MAGSRRRLRAWAKSAVNGVALLAIAPVVLTCWLEAAASSRHEGVFAFWSHVVSLLPGYPGMALRRAFYRLTLDRCSANFFIGFGALFTHRKAVVDDEVYIGPYALVGSAHLGRGCLIGSRASVLSGGEVHTLDDDGTWTPFDVARIRPVRVGEHAWIGEGAIIMADIGPGSSIAAGTVASTPVPPRVVMAGNPARFVRHLNVPRASNDTEGRHELRTSLLH